MPSINSQPVLPGVYSQVQEQLLPSVTGGTRVACFIGTGKLTNSVVNESVTRGSGNDDALAHTAVSLDGTTITDVNYATYESGVDYSSTPVSGGMAWLTGAAQLTGTTGDPYLGLSGKNFQLSVAGGPIQTIPFTVETTSANVATTLNEYFGSNLIPAVASSVAVAHATGTVTVVSYASLTGAVLTVNGVALTAGVQWTAATSNAATATSLAAAITTATATTLATAVAVGNVITITANAAGISGNSITVVTSDQVHLPVAGAIVSPSPLLTASTYAVLGSSTVTNTGLSVLTGNLGLNPGTSVTGFPPGTYSGVENIANAAAAQAQVDAATAYAAFGALPYPPGVYPVGNDLSGQDLGGLSLPPGVYYFSSSAGLTGTLTLASTHANDQWVFQIGSTLTTAASSSIVITGPGTAGNVYWNVGSSATLGASSTFLGTIIAQASITGNATVTVNGRLIALTGAVTLDDDAVTVVSASPSGSGTTLLGGSSSLKIATTATFNSSLSIENGTANAILGFVSGSLASTPSRPLLGVKYYVNYEWAKAVGDGQGSFTPQFYFLQNFSSITNAVGAVGGGDSQTANMLGAWTLPIAAQLAQQNGASIVCLMQMNPADGSNASQVRAALQKLFIPNINIVVSLDAADNAMLIPDITNHVETASSTINRLERTAFIGFLAGSNPSDATMLGYATAASSNRVVVVNQTSTIYSMFIGTAQAASTVDGTMMAAALAALRTNSAYDVAQPLTREVVSGISTTNTLAQAEKVLLSNNGVLIVDNISGSAKVVFGTTTNFADILDQLYQVVEISDYTVQTLRGLLDPIFIGQKLLANTPSQVETVSGAILTTLQQSNIITSFVTPSATVNPTQPTQILLNAAIFPVLELDSILITLGLDLV